MKSISPWTVPNPMRGLLYLRYYVDKAISRIPPPPNYPERGAKIPNNTIHIHGNLYSVDNSYLLSHYCAVYSRGRSLGTNGYRKMLEHEKRHGSCVFFLCNGHLVRLAVRIDSGAYVMGCEDDHPAKNLNIFDSWIGRIVSV